MESLGLPDSFVAYDFSQSIYDDESDVLAPWAEALFEGDSGMQLPLSLSYLNEDNELKHVFDESDSDNDSSSSTDSAAMSSSTTTGSNGASSLNVAGVGAILSVLGAFALLL